MAAGKLLSPPLRSRPPLPLPPPPSLFHKCAMLPTPQGHGPPRAPAEGQGRPESRRNGELARDSVGRPWGGWTDALPESGYRRPPSGFPRRLCVLRVNGDTCTHTGVGVCPGVRVLRLQGKPKVCLDSFLQHESSAYKSRMGTRWEESSRTATCHQADGRRGDICFQGSQGPGKLTRAAHRAPEF